MNINYNGWTAENITLELEYIAEEFIKNDMTQTGDAIREAVKAIESKDETVLSVLADGICKADEMQLYGIGDTLLDIIIALKTEWGISTD